MTHPTAADKRLVRAQRREERRRIAAARDLDADGPRLAAHVLDLRGGFDVVAEAGDGRQGIEAVAERLVAAEEELGPLFALVERAAGGGLKLTETVALFWHCLDPAPDGWTRARLGEAVAAAGLAAAAPALRQLLGQILQGR